MVMESSATVRPLDQLLDVCSSTFSDCVYPIVLFPPKCFICQFPVQRCKEHPSFHKAG